MAEVEAEEEEVVVIVMEVVDIKEVKGKRIHLTKKGIPGVVISARVSFILLGEMERIVQTLTRMRSWWKRIKMRQ